MLKPRNQVRRSGETAADAAGNPVVAIDDIYEQ
jgi:hypothetical protein